MTVTYTINGQPLDDPQGRWWVSDRTEETMAPPLELHVLNLRAGQIGETGAPSPGWGAAVWPLIMGIRGQDYADAKANKDTLDRLMLGRHGHATIVETSPGQSKMCHGIVAAGTEVERLSYGQRLDVAYPIRIPAGRWFDTDETGVTLNSGNRIAGTTADGTYLLDGMVGGSRDTDMTIQTIGNGSNTDMRLTDVPSGQWVRIAGNIILGTPIVIDPLTLTATAGGAPASGLLDFSARDLYLSPQATVRVQQNGAQPVTITARRAYA